MRIWKNKCIIEFNKQSAGYWQNNFYAKDPYEAKYQFLLNKRESTGLKDFNDPNAFIEYLNDVYKNDEEYNIDKVVKILLRLKKNAVLNLTLF